MGRKDTTKKSVPKKGSEKNESPKGTSVKKVVKDEKYYQAFLANDNVRAFLQVIRKGEGTLGDRGFYKHYGNEEYLERINVKPPHQIWRRWRKKQKDYLPSSAVGAFMFLNSDDKRYWEEQSDYFHWNDFLPIHQEIAAVRVMDQKNALEDVVNGNIFPAFNKLNSQWVSLPGGKYDQPTQNTEDALLFYKDNGGSLDSLSEKLIIHKREPFKPMKNMQIVTPFTETGILDLKKKKNFSDNGINDRVVPAAVPADLSKVNSLLDMPKWINPANSTPKPLLPYRYPSIDNKRPSIHVPKPQVKPENRLKSDLLKSNKSLDLSKSNRLSEVSKNSIPNILPTATYNGLSDIANSESDNIASFNSISGISSVSDDTKATTVGPTDNGHSVTVNLNTPMIGNFSITTTDGAGIVDLRRQVEEVLFEVINSVNTA